MVHSDKDIASFLTCVTFRPFTGLLYPAEQTHLALEFWFLFLSTFWEHFEIYWGRTLYKIRGGRRRRWGKKRNYIDLSQVCFSFGSLLNITNKLNMKAKEKLLISGRLQSPCDLCKLLLASKGISLCVSWNLTESKSHSYFINMNCLL